MTRASQRLPGVGVRNGLKQGTKEHFRVVDVLSVDCVCGLVVVTLLCILAKTQTGYSLLYVNYGFMRNLCAKIFKRN